MSKQTTQGRGGPRSPKPGRAAERPSRARVQAMEARAAASSEPAVSRQPAVESLQLDFGAAPPRPAAPDAGVLPSRARGRVAPRVEPISRGQEYSYIRGDMRRLLAIAGGLLVVMMVLLVLVER